MKKILVLMSTYNGEKYIEEQINSILLQTDIIVDLLIRDDGSNDNTIILLKKYSKNNNNINVLYGNNLGWEKSFMELVFNAKSNYDYYAFSDQDDVWLPNKLVSAVRKSEESKSDRTLYYSMMTQVDENLDVLNEQQNLHYPVKKHMVLFQNFVQGSTMVFSAKMFSLIRYYKIPKTVPHDVWIPIIATYLGEVIFDKNSYILYRKHNNAVTFKMKQNYWANLFKKIFKGELIENYGKYLVKGYKEFLCDNDLVFLEKIANYRQFKYYLIFNKHLRKISKKGTILLKLSILLDRLER